MWSFVHGFDNLENVDHNELYQLGQELRKKYVR